MKQTPLTRRKGLDSGCGLRSYPDRIAAELALAGSGQQDSATRHENSEGRQARKCLYCPGWHLFPLRSSLERKPAEREPGTATRPRKLARYTGFPPAVKAACRERSGGFCEGCGVWLGDGGEIQHRVARGKGGSRRAVISSVVNALHLCGTSQTGCHGWAESRDEHAHEAGLWLWNSQDPATEPVLLHSAHGSGIKVWLTPSGGYSEYAPGEAAA